MIEATNESLEPVKWNLVQRWLIMSLYIYMKNL